MPNYDFNWQTRYLLKKSKTLPAGTKVHCVAHFDNSKHNPNNPDPNVRVRWGEQTWDEMMIGYFDILIPIDAFNIARKAAGQRYPPRPGEGVHETARRQRRREAGEDRSPAEAGEVLHPPSTATKTGSCR